MPNHVTHRLVVTGAADAIAGFKSTFLVEKTGRDLDGTEHRSIGFDFNVLVPMPDLVQKSESSSSVRNGLLILGRTDIADGFGFSEPLHVQIERYLAFPWVKAAGVTDYEGLKALLLENDPNCLEKAQQAVRVHELYGHVSWYTWSIANWGTKWNAYGFRMITEEDGRLEFMFETAWSTPEPIFEALAARTETNGLTITIHAFDEGWGFAYIGSIRNGLFLGEAVEASHALHQIVYAEGPADAD